MRYDYLDTSQPEEPRDGHGLLVEPVDEDGDHFGVGAGRGEEGAQHPVQVLSEEVIWRLTEGTLIIIGTDMR